MAATKINDGDQFPVVTDVKDFDVRSGNWLENTIFNHRLAALLIFALFSVFLGYHALRLTVNASFENMIPSSHPYIRNFLDHRKELRGLGNSLRIVVENTKGDIFDPGYLKVLQDVSDTVSMLPGVDRPWVKSLWTPVVRWSQVTENGMDGGAVMPDVFDGSPAVIEQLRLNITRANIVGQLVAGDYKSSAVIVPLLDRYPDTGMPLDYGALASDLEKQVRAKETPTVRIHIIGFAKLVGDLIDGLREVMLFFAASAVIAGLIVFAYTRCLRSTLLLIVAATLGVVCLLGMMQLLGYELDPYSILVPFLIFAIGLSHGAQKMNGIMQDIGRGVPKYVAARYTFRRLFLAGLTALLANVVGFAVLMIIDIPVIRNLALTTSIGVTILIFTKLILIPVALSYIGVSAKAAARSVKEYKDEIQGRSFVGQFWGFFDRFTGRGWAGVTVGLAAMIAAVAFMVSQHVKIGDLDAGAPELRPESRYNRDVAFINAAYGASSDQFAVIVKTPPGSCDTYPVLLETGRLAAELEDVGGVLGTTSFYSQVVRVLGATNEGNPKWASLYRQPRAIGTAVERSRYDAPDTFDTKCSVAPLTAYLQDHKAETLDRVLKAVESFAAKHNQQELQFLPAAGSAGIEAITNIVVREANARMLMVLYAVVVVLCFITFRSWRAVVVAVIPLVITSMLCEAIMVWLGIGIKVATLPVIALGVGVGVDYALYLLSIQLTLQRYGRSLVEAYQGALASTGKIVGLVGMTMSAAVVTWAWSPIKFQADMGILLTFMFLWNMLGALILIPALSHFLLRGETRRRSRVSPEAAASAEAERAPEKRPLAEQAA